MPKYLAIDFLAQALRQKELLLSRMLLSCPDSDEIEPILQLHDNCNKNEKQNIWFKDEARAKNLVRYEKLSDSPLKLTSVLFGTKPECFETLFDGIGVGSGPGSPIPSDISDSLSEFQDEVVQYVCSYLDQKERNKSMFPLEGIDWHQLNEGLELEEMVVQADCFEEFLRRIPHFYDLAARLKPGRVSDPFLNKNGQPRSEREVMSYSLDKEISDVTQASRNVHKEVFEKHLAMQLENVDENEMEELSSLIIDYPDSRTAGCFSALNDLAHESDENSLNDTVNDLKRTLNCQDKFKVEEYRLAIKDVSPKTKMKGFVQLNETGRKDNAVKLLLPLLLESPPPCDIWSKIAASQNIDDNPALKENIRLQPSNFNIENSLSLCSPASQYKIAHKIETSNKLLDKISSLILEVPDLKDKAQNRETTRPYHLSTLTAKEEFASELELKLRWDPLSRSTVASVPNLQIFAESIPENQDNCKRPALTDTVSMIPWKDVYACCERISKSIDVKKKKQTPDITVVTTNQQRTSPVLSMEKSRSQNKIYSGIDDFVLLRTGAKSSTTSNPPKAIVKPAVPIEQKFSSKTNDDNNQLANVTKMGKRDYTVKVLLCKDNQNVFNTIAKHMKPLIVQLQEAGCISSSYTCDNLTPDYTRFILKQEEKRSTDGKMRNGHEGNKKFRMLVSLHALVNAAELLKECCVSAAKEYIVKTVCVQYRQYLGDSLDNVVADLADAEQRLLSMQVNHPKVTKTYELIREQLPQSLFSVDQKVLVLVFRGFKEISVALLNQLQKITGLKTIVLDKKLHAFSVMKDSHVIITDVVNIAEHFPWSSFSSVIIYEDRYEWLKKIVSKRPAIQHVVCLKGDVNVNQPLPARVECREEVPLENQKPKRDTYTLIGSTKITRNVDLLMCLEQKHDIIIIEREYDKIARRELTSSSKMCLQPDLLLDEKAAVIIENVIDFASEEGYKKAVDLILSTSFKCQMCNIILSCETNGGSAYSFFKDVQFNLAKFHSCLVSIKSSFPQFVVDVFYSHSVQQTATIIRQLCEVTKDSSNETSRGNWMKRDWLTDEITEHERFLLRFPSLNSFSAQLMLNKLPLDLLLTIPFTSLRKKLPGIPDRTLKDFKKMTDCGPVIEQDYDHTDFLNNDVQLPQFLEAHDTTGVQHETVPCDTPIVSSHKEHSSSEYESSQCYPRVPPFCSSEANLETGAFGGSSISRQMTKNDWKIATENVEFYNSRNTLFTTDCPDNEFEFALPRDVNYDYDLQLQPEVAVPPRPPAVPLRNMNGTLDGSTPLPLNGGRSTCGDKGSNKTVRRYSKLPRNGSGSEACDVVGVVQPKPRKIDRSKTEKKMCPRFPRLRRQSFGRMPQHSQTSIANHVWQESEGLYEKPEKKRRLTFEIVPGAKNGQTRLTFI